MAQTLCHARRTNRKCCANNLRPPRCSRMFGTDTSPTISALDYHETENPLVSPIRRVQSFVSRHPSAIPSVWLISAQFFLVQVVVASAWRSGYSWRFDAISDLGATLCGHFDGRHVCSPLHGLMNASLVLLGLTMVIGSALSYQAARSSRVGFSMMALAGTGAILVGLFPEDTIYWVHVTGQDLAFVLGNVALIVIGITFPSARWFKLFSIASGIVGLAALALFLTHNRFFLGLGGMERVVAYPLIIWQVVFGLTLLNSRGRLASGRGLASKS